MILPPRPALKNRRRQCDGRKAFGRGDSSASASSRSGISRPSALAVFVLITSSNLVGCSAVDEADYRDGLLRERGEGGHRCATEKRDEFPPPHSLLPG
jgi:hypothetical protein